MARDQKFGVKKQTGPLKFAEFRKSVQQLSPVGTSLPSVFALAWAKGIGR